MLAQALAAAHAKGVVHRDVKLSNLMLTASEPGLKVLDFGISKLALEERETPLTASSHTLGTPEAMAPEQILTPAQITDRCDVYLAGLVVYRLIAGRGPYVAETSSQYLMAHAFEEPMPLESRAPEVSPTLAALVHACLAKAPTDRPSMQEVAEALDGERADVSALAVARRILDEARSEAPPTKASAREEVTRAAGRA